MGGQGSVTASERREPNPMLSGNVWYFIHIRRTGEIQPEIQANFEYIFDHFSVCDRRDVRNPSNK
jgi:hypothetical protein